MFAPTHCPNSNTHHVLALFGTTRTTQIQWLHGQGPRGTGSEQCHVTATAVPVALSDCRQAVSRVSPTQRPDAHCHGARLCHVGRRGGIARSVLATVLDPPRFGCQSAHDALLHHVRRTTGLDPTLSRLLRQATIAYNNNLTAIHALPSRTFLSHSFGTVQNVMMYLDTGRLCRRCPSSLWSDDPSPIHSSIDLARGSATMQDVHFMNSVTCRDYESASYAYCKYYLYFYKMNTPACTNSDPSL
jgi:hypothetical protein